MQRRSLAVRGIVQGVGFRPFVYSLASRLSLSGFVRNAPHGVLIEIEGEPSDLERFEAELACRSTIACSH
jgi:hydrogenase maturation protein HypF